LHPINLKTAEPNGIKFLKNLIDNPREGPWKVEISKMSKNIPVLPVDS